MEVFASALLVLGLRLLDVPLSTVRMLYMVRGQRSVAAVLAFFEALIWLYAITRVFAHLHAPAQYLGWALGFALGTALGMGVEGWLAPGYVTLRVITRGRAADLVQALRDGGYGVTEVEGRGREGPVAVLFVVVPRRAVRRLLTLVDVHDPKAFITLEQTTRARGGHVRELPWWSGVRK